MTAVCVSGGGDSRSVPVQRNTCGKRQQGDWTPPENQGGASEETKPANAFILDSRLQINFCCLSHPDYVIFYDSPRKLMQASLVAQQ